MNTPASRILITGATGLLGRPVMKACTAQRAWQVTGTAFRRAGTGLERIDLSQIEQIPAFLDRTAPSVIIHTAAERHPDASEKDPAGTRRLNVDATAAIAQWAAAHRAFLIYISTDYVFDGTKAPYRPEDTPRPINAYGQSKLEGERAVQAAGDNHAILRVPILYGNVEALDESSVTVLAENMRRASPGARLIMEDWATRYPTHTADVAAVLRQMVAYKATHPEFRGIFHWSGNEPMTKYGMALMFAPLIGFDAERLVPDPTPPSGAPRPKDAHLDTAKLERLGMGQLTPFAVALPLLLAPHLARPPKA